MSTVLKRISDAINGALERAFYKLGVTIGTYPKTTLVLTTAIACACLVGLVRFQQEARVEKLWVPQDSDVTRHRAFVNEHFPPLLVPGTLLGQRLPSSGDAGVLEASVIKQLYLLHEEVLGSNVSSEGVSYTWDQLGFSRSPGGNVWLSSILALWNFNGTLINSLTTKDILNKLNEANLMDPWNGGAYQYETQLGGIKRSGGVITAAEAIRETYRIIANSTFDSGTGNDLDKRGNEWSKSFESVVRSGQWTAFSQMTVFTIYGQLQENSASINSDVRLLTIGYVLILTYVIVNLGRYSRLEHKVWLSFSGIVSTGLAIGVSFGLCSAMGFFYGPVHSVLPFLLLGIGVDDMFVIVQVWSNMSKEEHEAHTVPERLGLCLQRAGVSVTVTSITDLAAFLVGTSTILPALQSFCVYAGIGVFFDFVMQVTFFAATVALDAQRVDEHRDACFFCIKLPDAWKPLNIKGKWLSRYFQNVHIKALAKLPVKISVIVVTLIIAGFSIYSTTLLDIRFEFKWFLPSGSYITEYYDLNEAYFLNSSRFYYVYVGKVDYSNPAVQVQLESVMNVSETNGFCAKPPGIDPWLPALKEWASVNGANLTGDANFYPALSVFLRGPGARFASSLNLSTSASGSTSTSQTPKLLATSFRANFVHLPHTRDKIKAMDSVRDSAASETYPGGETGFAYSLFFLSWTTDKVIDEELLRNLLLAMAAVFIVTLLLIANLLSSIYVLVCVAFTVVDSLMVMHYWGLTVNTVTAVITILSIGLAVDYSAHIAHFFMSSGQKTRQERVDDALINVGVAVFNGGFSTFLAFVLLASSESYIFLSFFRILFANCLFGLWHGLVFLPVVLSLIGPAGHTGATPTANSNIDGTEMYGLKSASENKEPLTTDDGSLTANSAVALVVPPEETSGKWAEARIGSIEFEDDRREPELV